VLGERGIDCRERENQSYKPTNTNSTLTISSSKELKEAHRSNMTRNQMLGGGNGKPAPTNNLRKLEREMQHDKRSDAWWR
jgi:hypothetical protein